MCVCVFCRYRAYFISCPDEGNQIEGRVLSLAVSVDGLQWTRPMLDLYSFGNYTRTNILLQLDEPAAEISQVSVLACEGGYEMFFLASGVPPQFNNASVCANRKHIAPDDAVNATRDTR